MLNRLNHKLLLGSAIALASIGTLVGLSVHDLSTWNRAAARLERGSHEVVMDGIFHSSLTRATAEAVSFVVTGNDEYGQEAADALLYAQTAMAQLRRALGGPGERDRRPELRTLRQRQEAVLTQVRINVNKTLRIEDGVIKDRLDLLYGAETEADGIWREVLAWHDAERREVAQEMRMMERRMLQLVSATLVLGALWVLALLVFMARVVTGPINRLSQAAERVAGGDLEEQVSITSHDEIGALQRSFNRMVQDLRSRHSTVDEPVGQPAREADVRAALPTAAADEAQPTPIPADRHVLVVEVNGSSRDLTKAMLQHCGVHVTMAETGIEARTALAAAPFDLVLMDCELPEPDIVETVHQIRAANVSRRPVPIIALTQADVPDAHERCLAAGMNDQLAKPVSFFDLHALLARWLQPA